MGEPMSVRELIAKLKTCEQDAIVQVHMTHWEDNGEGSSVDVDKTEAVASVGIAEFRGDRFVIVSSSSCPVTDKYKSAKAI